MARVGNSWRLLNRRYSISRCAHWSGDSGDVYVFRFVGVAEGGEVEVSSVVDPVERWVLKRINHEWGGINHYERSGNYFLSEIPCDVLS